MTLSECWKRLKVGLKKTANIVAITILIVASAVTGDWLLLCVGTAMELLYLIGYLGWPSLSSRYHERFPSRARSESAKFETFLRLKRALLVAPKRSSIKRLDGVLLVVTIAGFVVILFSGFGKHLLNHPVPSLTHAEGWDAGAIIWTVLFLFYYTLKFPFRTDHLGDTVKIVFITWVSLPLLGLALYFMRTPIIHVLLVFLVGVCFSVIDRINWKSHPDPEEKDLSRTSFFWADLPMVVAFGVLIAYLLLHRDTEHPDVFVSGVVSCQLLISNAVFVVMEFGLLQPPKAKSGVVEPVPSA